MRQLHTAPGARIGASGGSTTRAQGIDRLRGLAIALMLLDHAVLVFGGPVELRQTVGRLAVPIFFVLAGHLFHRLTWRHGAVLLVGLALPAVVPWIDDPNVLVLYVLGCTALLLLRQLDAPVWLLPVVALTVAANGWAYSPGTGYEITAMLGLMGLGALAPRGVFTSGEQLPRVLGYLGRFPVSWYVGHLLALEVVRGLL